jgi:hypothetical protein
MKVRVEMTGLCRICGEPARTATPDGGGISSLCWDCTRATNAERSYPAIPKATPAELAEFDRTYLWATMADVLHTSIAQPPRTKRKRKAARG